ncbi:hypothetical protein AB0C12_33880 [Actinoplanes sp. NPDC048967]
MPAGRALVNRRFDTPDASRAAATWAAGHGAYFVTGDGWTALYEVIKA